MEGKFLKVSFVGINIAHLRLRLQLFDRHSFWSINRHEISMKGGEKRI